MIESLIRSLLLASVSVSALVGTRIYPLVLPKDCPLPATDYRLVGGSASPTFDTTGPQRRRLEVNCWSDVYGDAVTLRKAVVDSLNGFRQGSITIQFLQLQDFFDDELLQYRATVEFYIYGNF